jgi:hypothetical protein
MNAKLTHCPIFTRRRSTALLTHIRNLTMLDPFINPQEKVMTSHLMNRVTKVLRDCYQARAAISWIPLSYTTEYIHPLRQSAFLFMATQDERIISRSISSIFQTHEWDIIHTYIRIEHLMLLLHFDYWMIEHPDPHVIHTIPFE